MQLDCPEGQIPTRSLQLLLFLVLRQNKLTIMRNVAQIDSLPTQLNLPIATTEVIKRPARKVSHQITRAIHFLVAKLPPRNIFK